ncbi:hypothetical protein GCM10010361_53170 [Streptomyces olivaceiscleroticus]|uniref:Carrier domain-containing protein n=1 Tax=Streptomyces olivaceiscleroticus TaxID=68245 RepID=A0ABN1AQA0_9ACTN
MCAGNRPPAGDHVHAADGAAHTDVQQPGTITLEGAGAIESALHGPAWLVAVLDRIHDDHVEFSPLEAVSRPDLYGWSSLGVILIIEIVKSGFLLCAVRRDDAYGLTLSAVMLCVRGGNDAAAGPPSAASALSGQLRKSFGG